MMDRVAVVWGKIQEWLDKLAETVANGGASMKAAFDSVRAALVGKNPVWAAIKSMVSGLSRKAKIVLVLLLVLALLLAPVLLVVVLLAIVVALLVGAVRALARSDQLPR